MKKKMKVFRQLTMGLLTLMMCVSMAACSNDDGLSEEEQSQEELQGMIELLNLKKNLCSVNGKGEPVEAIFGKPYNASTPSERVYYTKSVSTAKSRFKLLFAGSTPCSADGNTYTLSNKQGSATFAEGNGKNGLLATATFNVPGLKGLVTKIYFIDVNEQGTNAGIDNGQLKPGTLLYFNDSWDVFHMITLGQWESPYGKETLLLAPYIIRYTKPTPWSELTASNVSAFSENKPIVEIMENYTEAEYKTFCQQLLRLLSTDGWGNGDGYTTHDDFVTHTYTEWDNKSFFIQVSYESAYISNGIGMRAQYVEKWEYLLIDPDNYANRTQLYTIENNQLPEALKQAIPLACLIGELSQAPSIEYLE